MSLTQFTSLNLTSSQLMTHLNYTGMTWQSRSIVHSYSYISFTDMITVYLQLIFIRCLLWDVVLMDINRKQHLLMKTHIKLHYFALRNARKDSILMYHYEWFIFEKVIQENSFAKMTHSHMLLKNQQKWQAYGLAYKVSQEQYSLFRNMHLGNNLTYNLKITKTDIISITENVSY